MIDKPTLDLIRSLADALWRQRTHELNVDGSPCWCDTELEPDEHGVECLNNRLLFLAAQHS